MAQKLDFTLPFNSLIQYVPQNLRNPVIKGLIDNLFDRHMTHDESVPFYGYIGRKPPAPDDRTPLIPESTVERDINSIIPVLNFKLGTQTYAFTVQDLINKARAVGITSNGLQWLYSQSNNYLPPIDIDKFANFFNYFWVAKAQEAVLSMPWNSELLPEYYTIAKPKDSDLTKLDVVAASTTSVILTGTGFDDQSFTITFSDPQTFTITANNSLGAYYTLDNADPMSPNGYTMSLLPASVEQDITFTVTNGTNVVNLLTFKLVRDPIYDSAGVLAGSESFVAGDKFDIDVDFLSLNYNVSFSGGPGVKGKIRSVTAYSVYQTIDGVQITAGQRVLVKNNTSIENGIYIVGPQSWVRASDYDGANIAPNAKVWVANGIANGGKLFTSASGNSWPAGVTSISNTNDWQEGNFWVHGNELSTLNLTRADVVQAVRPIIEYNSSIRLNSNVVNGAPSEGPTGSFKQFKTEFNQIPLFDLYRYDGTHSGLVSSIFFYVEDLTAELDLDLQKRVKLSSTDSADYVFNHGLIDTNGDLLFYKIDSNLKTIWHAGYTDSAVVDQSFLDTTSATSSIPKGTLNVDAEPYTQQQVWTIQAVTPTTFSVKGSKTNALPPTLNTLTVGVPYSNADFAATISSGLAPFNVDDTFLVRIGNMETPRYVYRDADAAIYDLYGGSTADVDGVGAFQVPRPFINNPYNESNAEILEGTLYSHFRGILQNQFEDTASDYAFGGSIKNWSEQQTLLASLLMQRDMTPISMIDLAQRQYEVGLNSIADMYKQRIIQYFATNGVVDLDGSAAELQNLNDLLDYLLALRTVDDDVRTVLFDTTSAVVGIPATLPQLGILPLVQPSIEFNTSLNRTLITHHDGHSSVLYVDDLEFRRELLNNSADIEVLRSDFTLTAAVGSFDANEPLNPYKGELWIRPNGTESEMLAFDVDSDDVEPPVTTVVGFTWYDRGPNILNVWDGTQYIAQPSHSTAWRIVDLADTLNQLTLLIEQRLYDGINPNARKVDFAPLMADVEFKSQLQRELFTYAANNGLDPLGSDFVASNAFSWNYSLVPIAALQATLPLSMSFAPARWNNVLTAHQSTVAGVIQTELPNLEPWKLLGFNDFTTWWDSLSLAKQDDYTPYKQPSDLPSMVDGGSVRAIATSPIVLSGLQAVDGISLVAGDRVLITNQAAAGSNGVYVVSLGSWVRTATVLVQDKYFTVTSGFINANTTWAITATVVSLNIDPVVFEQVRLWTDILWADIQAARPTIRLSVDTTRDTILPPYVSSTSIQSTNALTTIQPSGIASTYTFGDEGPVETVWKSSIDYGYALAKALFRHDPLMFLGFCWGFNWVEVDGILYDGYDVNTPGHKRFRLHGDLNRVIERGSENVITGTGPYTIVYDAYEVDSTDRYQNFSVRGPDGIAVGYVREGALSTIAGLSIKIEDKGQPFHIGDRFIIDAAGTVLFIPAVNYQYLGFGQIFTNALRSMSIDTLDSYAIDAFRGWDVNMGHRAGGLVATDSLKIRTDNDTLSTSSFNLLFKKNELARDMWIQALRVTVQQFGTVIQKPDGSFIPRTDGSDWVFTIEGYNPRFLNISYYDLIPTGTFQTFSALDQTATTTTWKEFTQHIAQTNTFLPLNITGIQNVVNFLFGYNRFLEDNGWAFNQNHNDNINAETGRVRTFQLEVEMFIDRCYRGIELDQGHIVNPFMDQIWVRQPTGILSEFTNSPLFDITGHAGVFDIAGVKFKSEDLYAIRGNQMSQFGATAPMYSAHAQIDEFEHLFVFKNFVEDSIQNGLLYDPFSGARVVTYKFNGRRQANATFRPEFGGHYLVGNEVRQNLQASTDNITKFFDPNHAFENETTTRHALALLGFNTKPYFDNLDISYKSQFNFWRGLIQSKGTNLSIDAYLNNNRFEDAKIDEYWAYKIATYGDSRQRTYPELKINVDDSLQQFTQLQFDATTPLPNFTQINRFDESRWFSIDDLDHDAYFKAEIIGSFYLSNATIGTNYTLPFVADKLIGTGYTALNATTITATAATIAITGYGPATPRYNPIKLFDYVDNQLVEEIPLWHPAMGQHTPTALESINIISEQNPAKYNFSTQVANNNTYDPLRPWGSNEIGRVWFDTRNLSYIPYSDETIFMNRSERLSRWGTLADFSTVDVYEWVQSSVPPKEYNALARLQAGDADLNPATKAAGEVALQETYVRDRIWGIRPIAWSYSSVPTDTDWGGLPPFDVSVSDAVLSFHDDKVALFFDTEYNTFAKIGIVAGMRIGGWDGMSIPPKPLSEYIVNDTFTKQITMGGDSPLPFNTLYSTSTLQAGVDVVPTVAHTSTAGLLVFVPVIKTTRRSDTDGLFVDEWDVSVQLKVISDQTTEVIELGSFLGTNTAPANYHGATITLNTDDKLTYTFPIIGIIVTVTVSVGGTFAVDQLALAISTALGSQVGVRDAVTVTVVVPNSSAALPRPEEIRNDLDILITDAALLDGNLGHGWRAWSVPAQVQLDADGRQPVASWRPYVGDYVLSSSFELPQIADAVAYARAPLTLNNGVVVQRYQTTWTDWNVLKNAVLSVTQVSAGQLQLLNGTTNIDASSTSVYVNGIAQLSAAYSVTANVVTLTSVAAGSTATVIIRPYQPSVEELAFDPEVEDDLTFQQQYKQDYEYVSLPVRDTEGSFSSTIYYFWVKNKSINAVNKKLSVAAIAQQLRDGPPNFLTFQNLIGAGTSANPYRYDAITISGLSYIVAKDDTFKLRFTRNFTLRDDPQQLDLKDTHTEWSLLRPNQRTRIPEALWLKLTDSLAGQDVAGNSVPALRRELYDERNGTTTRFGFEVEQTLAPQGLLASSVAYTIVNTKLINKSVPPNADGTYPADFIDFLDPSQADSWFATPAQARQTMTDIWNAAKPVQVNEIFFAALDDILANNYELTDVFKTSRLSAYSIKIIAAAPITPTYE